MLNQTQRLTSNYFKNSILRIFIISLSAIDVFFLNIHRAVLTLLHYNYIIEEDMVYLIFCSPFGLFSCFPVWINFIIDFPIKRDFPYSTIRLFLLFSREANNHTTSKKKLPTPIHFLLIPPKLRFRPCVFSFFSLFITQIWKRTIK